MKFNGWTNFEDLAKACGFTNYHNTNETKNSFNTGCGDIPNGFQSLNPELFIVIGEILGNIVAGSIPFNVQNALGNWLQLVGQCILTYNAQQQYFQGGPGRYFNPKYYNVNNPFCGSTSTNTNSSTTTENSNKNKTDADKIQELEVRINKLTAEISNMKNSIKK